MLGDLPENGPLYPEMTPLALLRFFGTARGITGARLKSRIDEVVQRCALQSAEDCGRWEPMLESWESQTRRIFISVYDATARPAGIYDSLEEMHPLLELFELEKALYELRYELANRPDWAGIPLRSLLAVTQ